jgi:tetratricopeptide (TPR) repeat protein
MPENGADSSDTSAASHLLDLALSRPAAALTQARELLSRRPAAGAAEVSIAHQAAGIALRDLGHPREGLAEMRRALRMARAADEPQREADVRASLGLTMILAGSTARGMVHLDSAVRIADGVTAGRVLMRRAGILAVLGRRDEALRDLNQVVAILHRHGDFTWEARTRLHRGMILLELGHTRLADADFAAAEQQFKLAGHELDHTAARHNRGLVAAASGQVPSALAYLAESGRQFALLGTPMLDVTIDRCAILLSAGLAADAWAETDAASLGLGPDVRGSAKFAELLYACATAALAAGDPLAARERAEQSVRMFRRQRRERWSARARLVLVQARHAAGDTSLAVYRLACAVARELDSAGAEEAAEAHLLAGRLALARSGTARSGTARSGTARSGTARSGTARSGTARGGRARAEEHLATAARRFRGGTVVARSRACLARAMLCELRGQEAGMLSACRRGLGILTEYQRMLGASELRAAVTAHGRELAAIGQRAAVRRGSGRQLLAWSERWRATAQASAPASLLALPGSGPGSAPGPGSVSGGAAGDEELARVMSALREVGRRLDLDLAPAAQVPLLRRERKRLEDAVRARILQTPGQAAARNQPFILADLLDQLGSAVLVELVDLDGVLYAVSVRRTGIRLHTVGDAAAAAREVDFARFLLRRLADERPVPDAARALADAGRLLEQTLLAGAAAELDSGAVVIVPPGRLHAVPWGLLPVLRAQSVSVSPSAAGWLRARVAPAPDHRTVVLVGGPDLPAAGAEIKQLAELYPQASVLAWGTATAGSVLAALDGSWLAHVAAHGTFRGDNPLFSSLRLDDGPLTVYDIEGITRPPHRLVLSGCESGRAAPAGADELLGLASSLMPMGTAGIVAAVVPVSDQVTPLVMAALHRSVAGGAGFPDALADVQAETALAGDPLALATACSFIALGV